MSNDQILAITCGIALAFILFFFMYKSSNTNVNMYNDYKIYSYYDDWIGSIVYYAKVKCYFLFCIPVYRIFASHGTIKYTNTERLERELNESYERFKRINGKEKLVITHKPQYGKQTM